MAAPIVSTTTARGALAVTPHHLASRAALEVIAAGGTAADGAVAANAVVGTVLPTTCGVGGDLFALVHVPGMEAPAALNASGRAGSGLDAAVLRAAGHQRIPWHDPASVTVPGCVDGWAALVERFGALPLAASLEPALRHAEHGFQTSPELADALERLLPRIGAQPSAAEFYEGGRSPETGEVIHRPGYTAVLQRIAQDGRDGFYTGPIAAAVAAATNGTITEEDLAADAAEWVDPIGMPLFGLTAWTTPPNSQGYLTPAALWLLEQLDAPPDPEDPTFHHAVVEAYRAVAWERDDLVADPDRLPLSPADLVDPDRLQPRLARIRPDRAAAWPPAPGESGGTASLCVIDDAGMSVSLIQSNYTGIGSGISAGDTGVWLQNRGSGFTLEPGHPNEAAPGRRPLHTLAPTLWTRDGEAALLLGTRGGPHQPQYLAQVAALLLRAGTDPVAAQQFPRWHIPASDGASRIEIEETAPAPLLQGLRDRGHDVTPRPAWQRGWGPVALITIDGDGIRRGVADPRVSTATARAR